METKYLLPDKFKKIGLISTAISMLIFLILIVLDEEFKIEMPVFVIWSVGNIGEPTVFGFEKHDISETITGILLLSSLIIAAFSRERIEDEYITKIRLESFIWSIYINCLFLLFSFIFFYGWPFALIMLINIYSVLFLFIVKFNIQLYKSERRNEHAE